MKIIESTENYEVESFDVFEEKLDACACLCGLSSGSGAGTKPEIKA
jgi:hypothetical protein